MKKTILNPSSPAPAWYWERGLHDARILAVIPLELEPDWKTQPPCYNCLELIIDAAGAMYDQKVQKISLYNYKILTPDFDLHRLSGAWWLNDELITEEDGKYRLQLTFQVFETAHERDYTVDIRFAKAEVERKK